MLEIKKIWNSLTNLRMLANTNKTFTIEAIDEELLAGAVIKPSEELHGDYLWLLILDLLIFIGLTFISYQASLKISENTENSEDPNSLNKLKFIKGLSYANGSKKFLILNFCFIN